MPERPKVLFLCTGNSCRSQMGEAILRHRAGDRFEALSAGTAPQEAIHPLTEVVMREVGIGLEGQRPKGLTPFLGRLAVRHLIIVCEQAEERCPRLFPGALNRHFWPLDDPAAFEGSEAEKIKRFRDVRDEIMERLEAWLNEQTET